MPVLPRLFMDELLFRGILSPEVRGGGEGGNGREYDVGEDEEAIAVGEQDRCGAADTWDDCEVKGDGEDCGKAEEVGVRGRGVTVIGSESEASHV